MTSSSSVPTADTGLGVRWLAGLGLAACCLVSGLLALIPSMALLMASMTIWRPIAVVDFFDEITASSAAVLGVLLLFVALAPVVIGTLALRHKAGWHRTVAPVATGAVVAACLVTIFATGATYLPLP